jgi:uncharacterized protein
MHRIAAVASATVAMLLAPLARATDSYAVTYSRDVAVRMRDGVALRADIYRPDAAGKFPVILERTPYDKNGDVEFGLKAARRGYVFVVEDVRGRYSSDGDWYPFKNESSDGYDTVEWAAALPYANGQVGMYGSSYVGATQMLAAIAHPPHLAGICPVITASDYHNNWTYQGGAFQQWFNESWTSGLAQDTVYRTIRQHANALDGIATLPLVVFPLLGGKPLPSQPQLTSSQAPYFLDWLNHPDDDEYWQQFSIEKHFSNINVPALHIAAWYDIFLDGSLRNYVGIKAQGNSEQARRGQRLLVVVGGHAGPFENRKIGSVDFGPKSPVDVDELTLRWYDWLLKGIANGIEKEMPVRIFVMGTNEWRDELDWPLARAKNTKYFLHSNSVLNTLPASHEKPDQYVYDPADAVPTIGGPLCCEPLPSGIGPEDQRPVEARRDVLVYTTPAFAKNTEVTGPVSLDLYVSSSALDTDFTGMLVDVWPNGFAQNLTSGILRLRYRDSLEKPQLATPGQTYLVTINLLATSNVFLAGHKLRLEIASSNFPRFDRNLNTGEAQATATRTVKATNVIYHDRAHPSALIVPVVP